MRFWDDPQVGNHRLPIFICNAVGEVWEIGAVSAQAVGDTLTGVVTHSGDEHHQRRAAGGGELVVAEQAERTGQFGAAQSSFEEYQQAGGVVAAGKILCGELGDMQRADDIEVPASLSFVLKLFNGTGKFAFTFGRTHQVVSGWVSSSTLKPPSRPSRFGF